VKLIVCALDVNAPSTLPTDEIRSWCCEAGISAKCHDF